MFNLVSTRSPKPFSAELLSIWMPPACPHARTVPPHMQDLHFFLELHEIPISPPLQPVDDNRSSGAFPPIACPGFLPDSSTWIAAILCKSSQNYLRISFKTLSLLWCPLRHSEAAEELIHCCTASCCSQFFCSHWFQSGCARSGQSFSLSSEKPWAQAGIAADLE